MFEDVNYRTEMNGILWLVHVAVMEAATSNQESVMFQETHRATTHAQFPPATTRGRKMPVLLAAAVLSCSVGSQAFAQAKAPAGPTDNVLATLSLKDGSIVQFNETSPGELVISALSPLSAGEGVVTSTIDGVSMTSLEQLDAVGTFKALAGEAEVPAALVQAQRRVDAAMRQSQAAATAQKTATRAPGASVSVVPQLSGSSFQSSYCPKSGYTFNFCWLNRTGSGYVQRSTKYIKSVVNAYKGNVGHKLQYKSCVLWSCKWYTNISWTVPQGYTQWISVSGSKKTRKASTYEATGDGYHWAIYGK